MARAGLNAQTVTEAAATIADEVGLSHLGMGAVADRLGVKTPSLYKHVGGLADVIRRVAILAADELSTELSAAVQGVSGRDALAAAARTMRSFIRATPGRYAAIGEARAAEPSHEAVELAAARERILAATAAVLQGYPIDPDRRIDALRMLRSLTHGFATLETTGGFQLDTNIDTSFDWLIDFVDRGLRAHSDA